MPPSKTSRPTGTDYSSNDCPPLGSSARQVWAKFQCVLARRGDRVSAEMEDAPPMCNATALKNMSRYENLVLGWLREYKGEIVAAEARFQIDRRAIAGAIAWEAVQNPIFFTWRGSGYGKNHSVRYNPAWNRGWKPWNWQWSAITTHDTLAKEAEDRGYVPPQTDSNRDKLIKTPQGAIEYIGAVMSAIADVYTRYGFGPRPEYLTIREDPALLTHYYQGMGEFTNTLTDFEDYLKAQPKHVPNPRNDMAVWVEGHLDYLRDAVGDAQLSYSPVPPKFFDSGGGQ